MRDCERPIGVFDSGLGGLTVARCIATSLPHESIYYVGDTKRCPYGVRPEEEVRSFVLQAGRWLAEHEVKTMVIACNTATAAGLRIAQQVLPVPVIGVDRAGRTRRHQLHAHAQGGRARHTAHRSNRRLHARHPGIWMRAWMCTDVPPEFCRDRRA